MLGRLKKKNVSQKSVKRSQMRKPIKIVFPFWCFIGIDLMIVCVSSGALAARYWHYWCRVVFWDKEGS